jgi:hypothetical protein
MPKSKEKGEKQIKKSVSKKKDSKPAQKEAEAEAQQTKVKSPSVKNNPSSLKKMYPKNKKNPVRSPHPPKLT